MKFSSKSWPESQKQPKRFFTPTIDHTSQKATSITEANGDQNKQTRKPTAKESRLVFFFFETQLTKVKKKLIKQPSRS